MTPHDTRGRVKGYKRLFDVGMEIEQAGELINAGVYENRRSIPSWLGAVGGTGWHADGSGPMEFSLPVAQKNLASLFVRFAEGVPPDKRWEWHNQIPHGNLREGSGCGSHIHFGTKQRVDQDMNGDSLSQITIFYNTAVTMLPFTTKWFSWGRNDTLRSSWAIWCSMGGLQRLSPSSISRQLRMRRGSRGSYSSAGFIIWNRQTKDKCTMELRVNEAMPQWSLAFTDVFLLIANKHIEVGDSPKLKNSRSIMRKLQSDIERNGKIHDMLEEYIEFYGGRELRAPVPHIIREKFPRRMKVKEFLHLIDRVCYWVFAYSSRKYYTKQLRFRALGGDPTRLPLEMMWEPWKFTVKQLFQGAGQVIPSPSEIKQMFPKVVKRTHTPFAHVRLGEDRLPTNDEEQETGAIAPESIEQVDSLRDLIDMFRAENEVSEEEEFNEIIERARIKLLERVRLFGGDYTQGEFISGCNLHRRFISHSCTDCLLVHDVITGNGIVCEVCAAQDRVLLGIEISRVYNCHHGTRNMIYRRSTQEIAGCQDCARAFHQEQHRDSVDSDGRGCTVCLLKTYNYLLNKVLPIVRRNGGML